MEKGRTSLIVPILLGLVTALILGVGLAVINLGDHTTKPENEEPIPVVLTDEVGDDGGYGDIKEIRLTKEGDNLILTMEVSENIPTWVGLDADIVWDFLIDVNKDNSYDFKVRVAVSLGGLGVSLQDNRYNLIERPSYELLGPLISVEISLTKIGSPKSFNLRAYSMSGAWAYIIDRVPDNGWVTISLADK